MDIASPLDAAPNGHQEQIAARAAQWRSKPAVDFPEPLAVEHYARAEQEYAEALKTLRPAVQLFRYGEWHTPGLSDIDLICLVDDDLDGAALRRIEAAPRSPLIVHAPLVMPRSIAPFFRYFLPATDVAPVGDPDAVMDIAEPDERQRADLCLISAFDGSLMAWRGLRLARGRPQLPVRGAMLRLWTIRHTILFAERGGLPPTEGWRVFADECAQMRAAFREGAGVDLDRLCRNLAWAESIACEVAGAAAAERLSRTNAPPLAAPSLQGGRVRVELDREAWQLCARRFGRRQHSYLWVSLPRDVAAFVAPSGGTRPFDRTLDKVRALVEARADFVERHDVYSLWGGKRFLGREPRKRIARLRDRALLRLLNPLR